MPIGGVLIGERKRKHFCVAIQLPDERKARGMSFFVKAMRKCDTRVTGQICHRAVQRGNRIRRVVGVVEWD